VSSNARLRAALAASQVTIDDVATAADVDPKTVQRWLTGRTPHARNRMAVAAVVDEDAHYLWPEIEEAGGHGAGGDGEVVATFAQRGLVPSALWGHLIEGVERRLDLLGYAMMHIPEQHHSLLSAAESIAQAGGRVRVVLADPAGEHAVNRDREEQLDGGLIHRIKSSGKYLAERLPVGPEVEIRCQDVPMYNSIFRFDDQVLVTPHLYRRPGWQSPCLHLRRLGPAGIFENYMRHFEDIWEIAEPMER